MKNQLLIATILVSFSLQALGQEYRCQVQSIDSVRVHYSSFEGGLTKATLSLDRSKLSFSQERKQSARRSEEVLIYQSKNYDTIDYLLGRISIIINNPPVFDTDIVIYDCCDNITIYVFGQGEMCEYKYENYATTYFPFAYAELYTFIRQHLVVFFP